MINNIADIRRNYSQKTLSEQDVYADPVLQFGIWWKEAVDSEIDEVNAMTLATASADGFPSARIVLLKDYSNKGFSFYTNYNSYKAQQLNENPKACLVFFWKELERQVRITGLIEKLDETQNDEYFRSRPEGSRIGAIASPQSQVIPDRHWLDQHYLKLEQTLKGKEIQRPSHWGGFLVRPVIIEFWQGRQSRLHDRIQYTLVEDGTWKIERLAP